MGGMGWLVFGCIDFRVLNVCGVWVDLDFGVTVFCPVTAYIGSMWQLGGGGSGVCVVSAWVQGVVCMCTFEIVDFWRVDII